MRCVAGIIDQEAERAGPEEDRLLAAQDARSCFGLCVLSAGVETIEEGRKVRS